MSVNLPSYKVSNGLTPTQGLLIPTGPLMLLPAAVLIILQLSSRRRPPGHYPSCGYNLTGNVSGICPECGVPCAPTSDTTATPGNSSSADRSRVA